MPDERILAVQSFLNTHRCGSETSDLALGQDFVASADKYSIPFQTLVPIYLIESGCGKHGLYNNYFGYYGKGGLMHFDSVADSIDYISSQLANGKYYAGKTLKQKIQTYNSVNGAYWSEYLMYYNKI